MRRHIPKEPPAVTTTQSVDTISTIVREPVLIVKKTAVPDPPTGTTLNSNSTNNIERDGVIIQQQQQRQQQQQQQQGNVAVDQLPNYKDQIRPHALESQHPMKQQSQQNQHPIPIASIKTTTTKESNSDNINNDIKADHDIPVAAQQQQQQNRNAIIDVDDSETNNNDNAGNYHRNNIETIESNTIIPMAQAVPIPLSSTDLVGERNKGSNNNNSMISSSVLVFTVRISKAKCKIWILLIIFVLLALIASIVGSVCSGGNCGGGSRNSNSFASGNNDDNNNNSTIGMNTTDSNTIKIESYLRNISLLSIENGNTNEILSKAEEMAIQWIIDDTTPNTDIDDPNIQRRIQQRFALANLFYASSNNNMWNNNTGWLQSNTNECEWFGITCEDGESRTSNETSSGANMYNESSLDSLSRQSSNDNYTNTNYMEISSIDLSFNNIQGQITPNICLVSTLLRLNLSNNQISGSIPNNIGQHCTNIRRWQMGNNQVTGTLPTSIGLWSDLRVFSVESNILSGIIPNEIGSWTRLESASFNNNPQLTGSIPNELCDSYDWLDTKVIEVDQSIDCDCCRSYPIASPTITPSLLTNAPATSITNAPAASTTNAPATSTTNAPASAYSVRTYVISIIPSGTSANDIAIQWIETNASQLNPNDTYGQFRIAQLYALLSLYYATNGQSWFSYDGWFFLDASILSECYWHGITCRTGSENVVSINLSNNGLQGSLPADLALLQYMSDFDVSINQISGTIPNLFESWTNLVTFYVWSNAMTGTIPQSMYNCTNLYGLSLGYNQLTGTIPDELITSTPYMKYFYVNDNSLTGSLPNSLSLNTTWTFIEQFSIANNQLSGTIPPSLYQRSTLTYFDASDNIFTGAIPSTICRLGEFLFGELPCT